MKRTFKTMIVLAILVTLLASPVTVCASAISEVVQDIENINQAETDATISESVTETQSVQTVDTKASATTEQTQLANTQTEQVSTVDTKTNDTVEEQVPPEVTKTNATTSEQEKSADTQTNGTEEQVSSAETQDTQIEQVSPVETQTSDITQEEQDVTTEEVVSLDELQTNVVTDEVTSQADTSEDVTEVAPVELVDEVPETISEQSDDELLPMSEEAPGKLELEIILRLPTDEPFMVKLQKDDEIMTSRQEKQDDRWYYHFDDLVVGTYTLQISGKNYVTYTQNLNIGTDVTKIILSNGHDINDALANSQVKYGVVGLGDVNR